jgi:hypothetical protein
LCFRNDLTVFEEAQLEDRTGTEKRKIFQLHVFRELGDWSGMDMVMRYAHLGGQHLQAYAVAVETPKSTLTSVVR